MTQNGKTEADRGMKGARGGHQRYESADNKSKGQAIIQEKMRRKKEVAEQFSINDPNWEQILKKMPNGASVKTNNFVDSQQLQLYHDQ